MYHLQTVPRRFAGWSPTRNADYSGLSPRLLYSLFFFLTSKRQSILAPPRYLATLGGLPPVGAAARGLGPRRPSCRRGSGRAHRGKAALGWCAASQGGRRRLEEAVRVPLRQPARLARVEPWALVRREQSARLGALAFVRPALRAHVAGRRLGAAGALVTDARVEARAGACLLLQLQAALELLAVEAHLRLVGDLLLNALLLPSQLRPGLFSAVELGVGLAVCRPRRALCLPLFPLWVAVDVDGIVDADAAARARERLCHLLTEEGRAALIYLLGYSHGRRHHRVARRIECAQLV